MRWTCRRCWSWKQFSSRVERNDEVRVIIITGAGDRAFVAGGDIADLNSRNGLAHYREFAEIVHRVFRQIEICDKPTIAAVNGYALGGGTELILATDIRILADTARLGLPEITLGLFPGAGGTQRIIRQVPPCRAKEIMFTGEQISAAEAVAIGLANKVVPQQSVLAEARSLGGENRGQEPAGAQIAQADVDQWRRHAAVGGASLRAEHDRPGARYQRRARGLQRVPGKTRAGLCRALISCMITGDNTWLQRTSSCPSSA